MNVAILGSGYIGLSFSLYLAKRGLDVDCYDIDKKLIADYNNNICLAEDKDLKDIFYNKKYRSRISFKSEKFKNLKNYSHIIITVGTPLKKDKSPNMSHLEKLIASINKYLNHKTNLIIKSTVVPTTTNYLYEKYIKKTGSTLSFCPERLAEGNALFEMENLPIIIGGINNKSFERSKNFFKRFFKVDLLKASNPTIAEFSKVMDNLWIDLNISLANELYKITNKIGVDALEIIKLANTLKKGDGNVNILQPSYGVGGYCLTKDPYFLSFLEKNGLKISTPNTVEK